MEIVSERTLYTENIRAQDDLMYCRIAANKVVKIPEF